jgi:hypothetical protein
LYTDQWGNIIAPKGFKAWQVIDPTGNAVMSTDLSGGKNVNVQGQFAAGSPIPATNAAISVTDKGQWIGLASSGDTAHGISHAGHFKNNTALKDGPAVFGWDGGQLGASRNTGNLVPALTWDGGGNVRTMGDLYTGNVNIQNGFLNYAGWLGPYKIMMPDAGNNMCADVGGNNGFGIQACNGGNYQMFYYNPVTGQLYNIQNSQCLSTDSSGNNLSWQKCGPGTTQSFWKNGNMLQSFKNNRPCVDLGGGNTSHMYGCDSGNPNQSMLFASTL